MRLGNGRVHLGDRVVTRVNDRSLRTDRGVMVRNRAGMDRHPPSSRRGPHGDGQRRHRHLARPLRGRRGVVGVRADGARGPGAPPSTTALLVVDEAVRRARVYVGMTRGREANDVWAVTPDHTTAVELLQDALARDLGRYPRHTTRAELPTRSATGTSTTAPTFTPGSSHPSSSAGSWRSVTSFAHGPRARVATGQAPVHDAAGRPGPSGRSGARPSSGAGGAEPAAGRTVRA